MIKATDFLNLLARMSSVVFERGTFTNQHVEAIETLTIVAKVSADGLIHTYEGVIKSINDKICKIGEDEISLEGITVVTLSSVQNL